MHAAAERIEPGAPPEFEALVRAHTLTLRRFCTRLAGPTDGEDLMQETLTRAMVSFGTLRDQDRFLPWCRQIARNTHARRAQSIHPTEPLADVATTDDVAAAVVESVVLRGELAEVLAAMPERSRHVLTARAAGVSPADLASELGVSRTLVDTWFARSRAQARMLLRGLRERGAAGAAGPALVDVVRRATRRRAVRRSLVAALVTGAGVTTLLVGAPGAVTHTETAVNGHPITAGPTLGGRPTAPGHPSAAAPSSPRPRAGRVSDRRPPAAADRHGAPYIGTRRAVAHRAEAQPIVIGPLLPDDQLVVGLNPCGVASDLHLPCPPPVAALRLHVR